jgi:hypothetical protein
LDSSETVTSSQNPCFSGVFAFLGDRSIKVAKRLALQLNPQ